MGGIDYNALYFWLSVLLGVTQILLGVYVWVSNRNRVTQDKIHEIELKYSELSGRVDALPTEARFDGIAGQVGKIDGDLKGLRSEMHGVREQMGNLSGTARRIEEFLLNNSGGKKGR